MFYRNWNFGRSKIDSISELPYLQCNYVAAGSVAAFARPPVRHVQVDRRLDRTVRYTYVARGNRRLGRPVPVPYVRSRGSTSMVELLFCCSFRGGQKFVRNFKAGFVTFTMKIFEKTYTGGNL